MNEVKSAGRRRGQLIATSKWVDEIRAPAWSVLRQLSHPARWVHDPFRSSWQALHAVGRVAPATANSKFGLLWTMFPRTGCIDLRMLL